MKNPVYYIQKLLVSELDSCKGKENEYTKEQIKEIQDMYKQDNQKPRELMMIYMTVTTFTHYDKSVILFI